MTIIADNFETSQAENSTLFNPSGSSPTPNYRATYPRTSIAYVASISENALIVTVPGNGELSEELLGYTYPPNSFDTMAGTITIGYNNPNGIVLSNMTLVVSYGGEASTLTDSSTTGTLTYDLSSYTDILGIDLSGTLTNPNSTAAEIYFTILTSDVIVTCLSGESKILTTKGFRAINTLQRGDETPQGKIARIIVEEIKENSLVELVEIKDLLVCSNHTFIHQGKRILAKSFPSAKVHRDLAKNILPEKKLYDIQYDFEGSYTVLLDEETGEQIESQSRSPYCKHSPLPKELYFNQSNYKNILVENTLREDPPY